MSKRLRNFDSIFGVQEPDEKITMLDIQDLKPYPNQPFKMYTDTRLTELAEDIKLNGILSPIIVRKIEDDNEHTYYEILAGHNRTAAAKLAKLDKIPAIIKDVDDDEAKLLLVNSNLNQRQELLPSEKAFAYLMQLESMKRQAGRPIKENLSQVETQINNPSQVGTQKRSDQVLAEQEGASRNQIQRYIRLTKLIPALIDKVDNGAIAFIVGVHLSYLNPDEQILLDKYITEHKKKISLNQAEELKRYSQEIGELNKETLDDVFQPLKPAPSVSQVSTKRFAELIPIECKSKREIEQYLLDALTFYAKYNS